MNKGSDKETLRQWTRQRDTQTMSQMKRYSVNGPEKRGTQWTRKRDTWTIDQMKRQAYNRTDNCFLEWQKKIVVESISPNACKLK